MLGTIAGFVLIFGTFSIPLAMLLSGMQSLLDGQFLGGTIVVALGAIVAFVIYLFVWRLPFR